MPGNFFEQFVDEERNAGPVIRSAPRVSPLPNDYQIGKDQRDSGRDDRREAREDRRETREVGDKQFSHEMDLRGKFDAQPGVKTYRVAIPQLAQGLYTSNSPEGDLALIYAYAKVMDPDSVVREGEAAAVSNTDTIAGRLVARLGKELERTGSFSPDARANLRTEMYRKVAELHSAYDGQRRRYIDDARAYGIDPVRVVGPNDGLPFHDKIKDYFKADPRRLEAIGIGGGKTPWQQDTVAPAPGGFAGALDGRKSIPIPPEMQAEYQDYVSRNRGMLDPDGYARMRARLDEKYGFPSNGPEQYETNRQYAIRANKAVQQGGNLSLAIPAPDTEMTVKDRVNNAVFNSPLGAAVMAAPLGGGMDEVAGGIRSLALGTDYTVERDLADATRQRIMADRPGAALAGSIGGAMGGGLALANGLLRYAPRLAGAMNTAGGQFATGIGGGAVQGALENNDNRTLGAGIGAGAGGLGTAAGRYIAAPLLESASRTKAADAIYNGAVNSWNAITGRNAALRNAPRLTGDEKALSDAFPELTRIRTNLQDARDLGLPYALGDASPKLRTLTGAVTRRSVDAREMADDILGQRGLDQADRAIRLIDTHLAPVTDLNQRRDQWLRAAQNASEPLYRQANNMGIELDDGIRTSLQTQYGRDALQRAVRIAEGEGVDPFNIGFVADDGGNYTLRGLEGQNAWRYRDAPAPDPINTMPSQTFRDWNNREFNHRGPLDLVSWVHQNGGLIDHGGELRHMGISRARRGMDFAGNDSRFGPLLNERGMTFDEAAERAWEAGYFPGHDRPDVNAFLDTFRNTYEGNDRRWAMGDESLVAGFEQAKDANNFARKTKGETGRRPIIDTSEPAGPRDFAPDSAYNPIVEKQPTFHTLDLVKRGLDARLNDAKNPVTGEIDFEGNPELMAVDTFRKRFVGQLDAQNGIYPQARAEYEKYIGNREALDLGEEGFTKGLAPRDMQHLIGKLDLTPQNGVLMDAPRLGEYRRGFATAMADAARNVRQSNNPFETIYGPKTMKEKVAMLYPDAPRFDRAYQLETDMNRTKNEALGGSATAGRLQADKQLLGSTDFGETLGNGAMQFATGGGVSGAMTMARNLIGDRLSLGFGNAGVERADRLAPMLMSADNQQEVLDYLSDAAMRNAEIERRRKIAQQFGGATGGLLGPTLVPQF